MSLPGAVLSDITHLLVSEDSPQRVLDAVADALAELVPHDTLTLFRAERPLRLLRPALVRDAYVEQIMAMGPLPFGVGITGIAAETGTPQLVNDAHLDPRAHQVPGTPIEPESLLALPLLARSGLQGVLSLTRVGEGSAFTLREFKLAIVFSELAALAIENAAIRARLEAEVVTDHLTALHNHRYFHERLGEELRRASRARSSVGLVLYDIDDFKRVNDTYGHLVGDQVLQGVAAMSRETCRLEDVICRIGGEEFAVVLPGGTLADTVALAERLRTRIEGLAFPVAGRVTVSVGVAEGPTHASSPRELVACADLALLASKAGGKNQTRAYSREIAARANDPSRRRGGVDPAAGTGGGHESGGIQARLAVMETRGEVRSTAHLRVLQRLSTRLNLLTDVRDIGELITAELRGLIDYHNCRVYVLQPDGETLEPIAFLGELMYEGETFDALVTKVGVGLTGHVAETGRPYYAPDAMADPFAVTIPGTPDLDESILAVPLRYGDRVTGVVVLSKLGIDQFDDEDGRLLEALCASAAVAMENARLLQAERESAEVSSSLLHLSQALTRVHDTREVLLEAIEAVPSLIPSGGVTAWLRAPESGAFRLVASHAVDPDVAAPPAGHEVPSEVAGRFLESVQETFVVPKDTVALIPPEHLFFDAPAEVLVASLRWGPEGLAALAIIAPTPEHRFSERDLRLARGIANIGSLALGNAHRFDELQQAYVATIEALGNALEAKDEYTEDHCRALARMSLAVGREVGLSEDRLKVLELGALFHDIGKIGIPSEILRKPRPLSAEEWRIMKRHPVIGSDILAPVAFLEPVRPIIRASHERWDGKGYPFGLKGEQIPLEARIVFVCDAFHAMTTDRPYRQALPEREAVRRLRLASGRQFDPEIVSAFTRLHREGRIHAHAAAD